MTPFDESHRHQLILHFCRLALVAIVAGTVLRPLLVDLPIVFTLMGVGNTVAATIVFLLIRSSRISRWELPLMIILGYLTIAPLVLISGGVNSQFSSLLSIFPLFTGLIGGSRAAWWVWGTLVIFVLGLLVFADSVPDLTGDTSTIGKSISRGFWLVLSITASAYFGAYFERRNNLLAQKLDELATRDHLTGLLNRRGLTSLLNVELARGERSGNPLTVLLIDIDHFKAVNDQYGHNECDRCLQRVATCLQQNVRAGDLLGRHGGEEFVVVLIDIRPEAALLIAEKLRQRVAALTFDKLSHPLTITVGVSGAMRPGEYQQSRMLKQADEALYRGKRMGRNRVELADEVQRLAD